MKTAICVGDMGRRGYILRCDGLIVFPPNGVMVRPNWKYKVEYEEHDNPRTGKKYGVAVRVEHVHEFEVLGEEERVDVIPHADHYTIEKKKVTKLRCIRCLFATENVEVDRADFVVAKITGKNSVEMVLVPYDEQSEKESYKFFDFDAKSLRPNVEYRRVDGLLLPANVELDELDVSYKELDYDIYVYTNGVGPAKVDEIEAKCLEVKPDYDEVTIKRFINSIRGLPITEIILRSGIKHSIDIYGHPMILRVYDLKKIAKLADFVVIPKYYVNKARMYAALFKALYNILISDGFRVEIRVEGRNVKVRVEKDGKVGEAVSNAFEDFADEPNFDEYYGIGYYGPLARVVALLVGSQLCIKRCREVYPLGIPYVIPKCCPAYPHESQ